MNDYEAKQEEKRDWLNAAADRARSEAARAHKTATDILDHIPMGQPILVGHHSEKRHRRDLEKVDNAMRRGIEGEKRAEDLRSRAAAVGSGGISADDPAAVGKLREKLAKLEAEHAQDKKVSAAWRKAKKPASNNREVWEKVAEILGLEPAKLANYINNTASEENFGCARGPVPSYVISNRNGNMKRIRGRIADLERRNEEREAMADEGPQETRGEGFSIVEDHEDNRLRIFFDEKPKEEMRKRLKSSGFRWSPTAGAWQRQLTNNARHAARYVLGILTPTGE